MKWDQARKLLRLAGDRTRREIPLGGSFLADDSSERPASICVASGKGGTGKSVVTASLASLFARRGRTLIVDADLGVGNAHILQNVSPEHSFVDVVEGRMSVHDIVTPCGSELDLLAAGSGVSHMSSLSPYELHLLASGIETVEDRYRFLVVDSAAGISNQTVCFAAACDLVLLVTTPDLTAMTDAYAFFKVLLQRCPQARPLLVVNRSPSYAEAEHVAERMCSVSRKFLEHESRWIGTIPEDVAVLRSVNQRSPVVETAPQSAAAQALRGLSVAILEELAQLQHPGVGRALVRDAGYSQHLA